MLGDTVLKKADTFQGKRKVKDQWSEVEYEVICQVTNVSNPSPCQLHSARMGGWCTVTTSYGGPQISTKGTRVKDEGNAWRR